MKISRVLNIEDTISKHVDICRSLGKCGVAGNIIDHATTALDGLAMIEKAIKEEKPYDLLVLDMYFPIAPRERMTQAGLYVLEDLKNKNINIPVIICSSVRLSIPDVVGCIHYNEWYSDLDGDMKEMIEIIRTMEG